MKAVILAGGFGTRISEESQFKPKPMIEIGEMPIIWHIMKHYSHYGINDFVILLGYKGYMITITILTVLCYALSIWADTWYPDLDMDYEEMVALEKRKSWIIVLTQTFSMLHFPFVVYGWIVFAIRGKRRWQIQQETASENSASISEKKSSQTVWVKDEEEAKRYMEDRNIH